MAVYRRDREELRKLRRNATKKLSRLRTTKGIGVSGIDPRRALGAENAMTRKELNAYKQELRLFTSRTTSFEPGIMGRPISGNLWREYRQVEQSFNAWRATRNQRFADIQTVFGMSFAQYMAATKPAVPQLANDASNRNYDNLRRSSRGFASNRKLRQAIDNLKMRMSEKYQTESVERDRRTAAEMLQSINRMDLVDRVNALSTNQFDMLWRGSRFAAHVAVKYETHKLGMTQADTIADQIEAGMDSATEQLSWAEQLSI